MPEKLILATAWAVAIIVLINFVPKSRLREAFVIFLFTQLLTWALGLAVVEYGLIEYPVRLFFSSANKTSFTFEYFIYPSVCVVFILHYPSGKSRLIRWLYYVVYCTGITGIEVLCEEFTDIIQYIHWDWYITWITLFLTFYFARRFYLWFFKIDKADQ